MTRKEWIVTALLRLYPAAWRSEYGNELTDILLARRLGPRVIADVAWNGFWLRARAAEPSTILGFVAILIVLCGFVVGGSTHGRGWVASQWKMLPAVGVTFLASGIFALLQFICGCWSYLRHPGTLHRSGLAAMRMALITGIPVMLAAVLMMFGLADLRMPGTPLPPPSPLAMFLAPLTRLPDAWIWGALGGLLGRRIVCERQRASAR